MRLEKKKDNRNKSRVNACVDAFFPLLLFIALAVSSKPSVSYLIYRENSVHPLYPYFYVHSQHSLFLLKLETCSISFSFTPIHTFTYSINKPNYKSTPIHTTCLLFVRVSFVSAK